MKLPGGDVNTLLALVESVGDRPTVQEVDAMLAELRRMPRDAAVTGLIDDLLDYRSMLSI
jgi:hypothetical protein